ncbi:hypothetical protein ACFYKX_16300 [Cytobacillus sp. FJAT-54145]|uniref:Uncharacterized protein n=1 Tax=Cytobacillus spartinae TaxID=3299023 RepID=A0ABW6KDA9_9BACI
MISQGYTVSKKTKTDWHQMLIPAAFILILGSTFISLFFIVPVQSVLYHPEGDWFFEPPKIVYYTSIASQVLIGIIMIIYALLLGKGKNSSLIKMIVSLSILVSFIVGLLCFDYYHYATKEGIHVNPLFSLDEKLYAWNDIEHVKETFRVKNGVMSSGTLIFTFKGGEQYTLMLNNNVLKAKRAMIFEVENRGIEIERDIPEGY